MISVTSFKIHLSRWVPRLWELVVLLFYFRGKILLSHPKVNFDIGTIILKPKYCTRNLLGTHRKIQTTSASTKYLHKHIYLCIYICVFAYIYMVVCIFLYEFIYKMIYICTHRFLCSLTYIHCVPRQKTTTMLRDVSLLLFFCWGAGRL